MSQRNADIHQQLEMLREMRFPYFPFANTLILADENNLSSDYTKMSHLVHPLCKEKGFLPSGIYGTIPTTAIIFF